MKRSTFLKHAFSAILIPLAGGVVSKLEPFVSDDQVKTVSRLIFCHDNLHYYRIGDIIMSDIGDIACITSILDGKIEARAVSGIYRYKNMNNFMLCGNAYIEK